MSKAPERQKRNPGQSTHNGIRKRLWLPILAIFGCAEKYCCRETPVTRILTQTGFGLCVLQCPICLIFAVFCIFTVISRQS